MGTATGYLCNACGTQFAVRVGGGFSFDLLHCETCGRTASIRRRVLDELSLGFAKGLSTPGTVAPAVMDQGIPRERPNKLVRAAEFRAAAEATLDPCSCGGRFRYDAPGRCPKCRSTRENWVPDGTPCMYYD